MGSMKETPGDDRQEYDDIHAERHKLRFICPSRHLNQTSNRQLLIQPMPAVARQHVLVCTVLEISALTKYFCQEFANAT